MRKKESYALGVAVAAALLIGIGLALPKSEGAADASANGAEFADDSNLTDNSDGNQSVEDGEARPISQAFLAAFGTASPATVAFPEKTEQVDGYTSVTPATEVRFRPGTLINVGSKWILVSIGEVLHPGHGSQGRVAVHYLRRTDDGFAVERPYVPLVESGSFGKIAEWSVSNTLSEYPVLYVEGGFGNMGIFCSWVHLAELTPSGPVLSPTIQTYYTDEGSLEPAFPKGIEGKIGQVRRDKSFVLNFTGDENFSEKYVKRGGKFVVQSGKPRLDGC